MKVTLMTSEGPILSQFRHENETWKRILEFLSDENIYLKNRLSEILRNIVDHDHVQLNKIEQFHNRLLNADDRIKLLRKEVAENEMSLNRYICLDGSLQKDFQKKQNKLMKDLKSAEGEFNKLKYEFNSYLDEIL